MRRAIIHHPSSNHAQIPVQATVTLTYDDRHRRRISLHDDNGAVFLLDLPHAVQLGDGDLLELESGGTIQVCAADEDVLDVTSDTIEATAKMAWHIGNRHIPIQVLSGSILRIRYDHVLEHMILDHGAACERKKLLFHRNPARIMSMEGTQIMLTPERQLDLMTRLPPAFPVGAFSYSHSIEYAVGCGLVTDKNTLDQWITGIMQFGSGFTDAILFAETRRSVIQNDIEYLMRLNEYAFAFRATNELALESSQLGQSFVDMQMAYNPSSIFQKLQPVSCSYPIAIAAAEQHIPLQEALVGYLHALASNLVSAGVRIIPLGQVAGLQVLSQIHARSI